MLLPSQRSCEANVSHLQMCINCCWQQRARFPLKWLQQLYAGCECLEEDSSFQRGAGLLSRGLPAREPVPSLAARNLAVKQLWGRTPPPYPSYLLDKNPPNPSENHPMTSPVFGTKSPKFLISQQECGGQRSAGRECNAYWVMGERKDCWGGLLSLFERRDSFIEFVHCCNAVLLNTGLYCSLGCSLEDHRAGDRLPTPETRAYPWRVVSVESYGLLEKSATSRFMLKTYDCSCVSATCIPSPSPPGCGHAGGMLSVNLRV